MHNVELILPKNENLIKEAVLSPIYFVFLQVLYTQYVDKYNKTI